MSEPTQLHDADIDQDPWANASPAANDMATSVESPSHEEDPFGANVVDAAATELPPRKKSIVPKLVIGGVVIAVLGVAGSGMYNLYRKIRPAPQEVAVVDTPVEAREAAPAVAAIPGGPAPGGAATTIGASVPAAPIDPAAVAAPAEAAATLPATTAPHDSGMVTVTTAATPVAATPNHAPAAAAGTAPAAVATPQVPAPRTEAAKATQSPHARPLAQHTGRAATKHRSAAKSRPTHAVAAASAGSSRAIRVALKRRPAVHAATIGDSAPAKPTETEQLESSLLTGFRIESIEPHFGVHQNAWIRSRTGRLQVVRTGDMFEGGKVLKVDAARYEVVTTQGVIR